MPVFKVENYDHVAPENQLADPYTGLTFAKCLARLQPEDVKLMKALEMLRDAGATDF